jgi:hypothetical protein
LALPAPLLSPGLAYSRLQRSAACRDGHRLILYIDACFSGHWAIKAKQLSLSNVIVQTSCSSTETSLDGVFTKAFVDFQNSRGTVRPSSQQLCMRTPSVYVPWPESEGDTVICKDFKGRANRSCPYMHLLSDSGSSSVYRLDRTTGASSVESATETRRRGAEAAAAAVAAAEAAAANHKRALQTLQMPHHTAKAPNKSTIAGIEWAATHDRPNEDLKVTGGAGGWPPGLFGPERSRALVAKGIATFSQLIQEVKSSTKEEFYKSFGTCDGRVGALDTAANTMWEVCMAWDCAASLCERLTPASPVKSLGAKATTARPATPPTAQKAGTAIVEKRTHLLNAVLKNMQIDLQILRNAAAGCSASQRGLNIPEIKQVLSHFNIDANLKRADLNMKLADLLVTLGAQQ